jgi:hypothetical protein
LTRSVEKNFARVAEFKVGIEYEQGESSVGIPDVYVCNVGIHINKQIVLYLEMDIIEGPVEDWLILNTDLNLITKIYEDNSYQLATLATSTDVVPFKTLKQFPDICEAVKELWEQVQHNEREYDEELANQYLQEHDL